MTNIFTSSSNLAIATTLRVCPSTMTETCRSMFPISRTALSRSSGLSEFDVVRQLPLGPERAA